MLDISCKSVIKTYIINLSISNAIKRKNKHVEIELKILSFKIHSYAL